MGFLAQRSAYTHYIISKRCKWVWERIQESGVRMKVEEKWRIENYELRIMKAKAETRNATGQINREVRAGGSATGNWATIGGKRGWRMEDSRRQKAKAEILNATGQINHGVRAALAMHFNPEVRAGGSATGHQSLPRRREQ